MSRPIEAADVAPYTKVRSKRNHTRKIIDSYEPSSQMVKLGFYGKGHWEYTNVTIADLMNNWEIDDD